jgi:glycosyltransferase involved in cell wall biosynthesis
VTTRVCMLTSVHSALDERIFYKEARSLAGCGYDVVVVGPHRESERRDTVDVIAVTRRTGKLARMLRTSIDVLVRGLGTHAEIYHFHDPELIPLGLLFRLLGKRVIYDIHEYTAIDVASKHWIPLWIRPAVSRVVGWLEDRAVLVMNGVVVVNDDMAERVRRLVKSPDRVVSVHNFPEVDRFLESTNGVHLEPFAIYVGGLSRERGWEILLEAGRRLRTSYPNGRLEVLGPLDPGGVAPKYADPDRWSVYGVHYGGIASHIDVPKWMSRARVGLLPLLATPAFHRAMPVKLFEYMAAGLPVVASDFGSMHDIVHSTGCGLLVRPGDPVELSDAVASLLRDPATADAMGQRGRRAVLEKYSWPSQAAKLRSLYEVVGR